MYIAPIALASMYILLFSMEETNVERLRVHRVLTENKIDLVHLDILEEHSVLSLFSIGKNKICKPIGVLNTI